MERKKKRKSLEVVILEEIDAKQLHLHPFVALPAVISLEEVNSYTLKHLFKRLSVPQGQDLLSKITYFYFNHTVCDCFCSICPGMAAVPPQAHPKRRLLQEGFPGSCPVTVSVSSCPCVSTLKPRPVAATLQRSRSPRHGCWKLSENTEKLTRMVSRLARVHEEHALEMPCHGNVGAPLSGWGVCCSGAWKLVQVLWTCISTEQHPLRHLQGERSVQRRECQ